MNDETTNEKVENSKGAGSDEKWAELIKAVRHNGLVALKIYFDEVDVQVLNQPNFGPLFVYHVKDASGNSYSCGFFLRELVSHFQSDGDPAEWMASFFFEWMKVEGGKELPKPPASEVETKAMLDNLLIPQCIAAVKEEFAPEKVHAGLNLHKEHGPVLEAGFPAIREGNNVCAFPLQLLLMHLLLNRDPAEPLLQGLYKIREEHGLA